MFQDGCKKDLTTNQLSIVTEDRSTVTEESDVPTISAIPGDKFDSEKGYYHRVYIFTTFYEEGR